MLSSMPFNGCRQRIERAKAHREALAEAWEHFLDSNPYRVIVHMENNGTGRIWVEPTHSLGIPPVFGLEFGEMLYQLRSALDGCIFDAAVLDSGQNPPPNERNLEFPICESRADYPKKAARNLGPLAEKRKAIVESVQPYNAPNVTAEELMCSPHRCLRILNDWARKDRHRRLHFIGSLHSDAKPMLRFPEGVSLASMVVSKSALLEKEGQVAMFTLDGYVRGMEVSANPNLAIDIAIDEIPPPCCTKDTFDARITLMRIVVEEIVSEFEKSFGIP